MTRARNLANLGNKNAITADIGLFNIGIGSTQPTSYKLEVVGGDAYIGGGVTITGNLSVGGTVTYEDVTNVDAVGIITANSGVNIVGGGLTVTGVGTFFGAIDANGALDVDGHTELDDVNVSGASTFAGLTTVTNAAAFHSKQLNVSGVATVGGNLTVGDTIYVPEQIVHTGDTNTKIKFPADDTISFETAGGEKLRIDSTGIIDLRSNMQTLGNQNIIRFTDTDTSVAIGQTMGRLQWYSSDASGGGACVKAEIQAACTDTTPDANLRFYTHDGSGTEPDERLRIDSTGRLLINRTASRTFIGDQPKLQVEHVNTGLASFLRTSNDALAAFLVLAKSRSAAGAVCQAGDEIGRIPFIAHDGTDFNNAAADIRGYVDTGIGSDDVPGYLTFSTNGGTTSTTERLRIDSAGMSGFWTTAPRATLHLKAHDNNWEGGLLIENNTNGNGWNFHPESSNNTLLIGYNDDTTLALASQSATTILTLTSTGLVTQKSTWTDTYAADDTTQCGYQIQNLSDTTNTYAALRLTAGTNSPATAQIASIRTGTGSNDITFQLESSNTAKEALRITSAGRLLLGTSVDSVFNGGRNASFQQEGTDSGTSAFAITRNSNDANPSYISLGKSRGTSAGANTAVQNGDGIGTIEFNAGDGSGSFNAHALIKGSVDGAPGNSDAPGRLSFWTTPDGSGTPAERMRITAKGDIGINTTGVTYSDHIYLAIRGNSTDRGGVLHLGNSTHSVTGQVAIYDDKFWLHSGTSHPVVLGAGGASQMVTLSTAGKLGIGANSPDTLLHVAGNGTAVVRLENSSTGLGQDDLIGAVEFEKQDASGAGVGIAGGMRCRSNDSYGARSYLAFSVRSNSTGAAAVDTEVVRMTTSGICFNGDISDGALNDYEEGSWTPAPSLGSLTHNNSRYVRVGRKVTVWANISGITELSSGNQLYLTGLPFTTEISQAAGSMMGYDINSNDTTTAYISHTERLYFYGINAGTSWETNSYSDYTANSQFYVVATYEAT